MERLTRLRDGLVASLNKRFSLASITVSSTRIIMKYAFPLSRRQFLRRTTTGLGAAFAAPTLIPASALGLGGAPAPSERINMGFVGLGGQGSGHLLGGAWTYVPGGYVARPDVQVLAFAMCAKNAATRRRRAATSVVVQWAGYSGVKSMTSASACPARHRCGSRRCPTIKPLRWPRWRRGRKDIYCEKPIAITVREGRNLIETPPLRRIYQASTQQRSIRRQVPTACELVPNGRIGQLKRFTLIARGAFSRHRGPGQRPPVPGFDWDLGSGRSRGDRSVVRRATPSAAASSATSTGARTTTTSSSGP